MNKNQLHESFISNMVHHNNLKLHRRFKSLIKAGNVPTPMQIWQHNVVMVNLDSAASMYAVSTAKINANDSVGCSVYLNDDKGKEHTQEVSKSPRNEAWYSVANSTLASIADDWETYMSYGDNGTIKEWAEFVYNWERYAL